MHRDFRSVPAVAGTRRLIPIVILLAAGCGSDDGRVKLYPTTGKVTIGDEPTAGIEVRLLNAANPSDLDAPQPFGMTDESGVYRLGTFEEGDGAPAGDYVVVLRQPEGPSGPNIARDLLGNAFTNPSRTPYRTTIPEEGGTLEPFRIDPSKIKKLSAQPAMPPDPTNPR